MHGQEVIILAVTRVSGILFSEIIPHAGGGGRAVMTVCNVGRRYPLELPDDLPDQSGFPHHPEPVTDAIIGCEIILRNVLGNGGYDLPQRGNGTIGKKYRLGIEHGYPDMALAIGFLIRPGELMFFYPPIEVVLHRGTGNDTGL